MSQKFGADRFKQIEAMMKLRFVNAGLPEPASDMMIRQTTGSHRLVWKAGELGGPELQNTVVGTLYKRHFIDGKDVGDIEGYLSDVAVETGLFKSEAEAVEWLNSEEGLPEYQEAVKKAQSMGISGVPFWT
jgi:predicted DsbA family dithiol-disulfide isomerase